MKIEIEPPKGFEFVGNMPRSLMSDGNYFLVSFDINPIQHHEIDQHAELKAQYAIDAEMCKDIDGLEAWQLCQYRNNQSRRWEDCVVEPYWQDITEYRRHPHAESMILFHKGSAADKKRWQRRHLDVSVWVDCIPEWAEVCEYRMKPSVIGVTLDDGTRLEFPEPVRDALNFKDAYYIDEFDGDITEYHWTNDAQDMIWLEQNRIFRTEEDAQAAQAAIQEILSQRS
jgi:hypothetical protein